MPKTIEQIWDSIIPPRQFAAKQPWNKALVVNANAFAAKQPRNKALDVNMNATLPSDGEPIDTETSNNVPPSEILLTPSKAKLKKTALKVAV